MKKTNKNIAIFSILTLLISGCSLTPYESEFSCTKGIGEGSCDSVTNIYKSSFIRQNQNNEINISSSKIDSHINKDMEIEKMCESTYSDIFEACSELHGKNNCNKENITQDMKYLKCVSSAYKELAQSHYENTKITNELLEYQHLRNETLYQKIELGDLK